MTVLGPPIALVFCLIGSISTTGQIWLVFIVIALIASFVMLKEALNR